MKRIRITAWVLGLVAALGVSTLLGTVASSGAATSAHVAKASANAAKKKKKKKKPTKCPKGTKKKGKKGKVCIKTVSKTKTKVIEREIPGPKSEVKVEVPHEVKVEVPHEVKVEVPVTKTETKTETKEVPGATHTERVTEVVQPETAPPVAKPELGVGAVEKGATKAIENASEIPVAPEWTEEQLNNEPSGNWISSMGGTTGDHFSREKEITASNVTSLKSAWMTQLDGSGDDNTKYSAEGTPVEYEGVIYYATGADDVFAVSVASGKILWVHAAELPETVEDVCCGWDNRGISIADGMVFSSVINGYYEALNEKTGALIWKTEVSEPTEGQTTDEQPTYWNGELFGGSVGSDYGSRGYMTAMNAKTGALLWKHFDTPGPGEFGHNTWPSTCPKQAIEDGALETQCDDEYLRGGAGSWNGPTVDDKTGLIYYATANAAPNDQGVTRGGEDLWSVSLLALEPKTGELAWGYQMVHHDVWDYDSATLPSMINVKINGKTVEGIIHANKDGYTYFVNAENGEPVFPIEEKEVPHDQPYDEQYPTQPIPSMPPFVQMKATPTEIAEMQAGVKTKTAAYNAKHPTAEIKEPTVVQGGYNEENVFAGAWPPGLNPKNQIEISSAGSSGSHQGVSAYDPTSGDYYVCARKALGTEAVEKEVEQAKEPGRSFGGGGGEISGSTKAEPGYVTGYSLETGKIIWMDELPHQCFMGLLATEGNLVFATSEEGNLVAYEASTGKELWKFPLGAVGGPAMAFEWNGKEYIVDYGGGDDYAKLQHGDNLWAFVLNGTGPPGIELGKTPAPETQITE